MKKCLLCGQYFISKMSFLNLFSLHQKDRKSICDHCLKKFIHVPDKHCPICSGSSKQNQICSDCVNWQKIYGEKLLINHSVYLYNRAFHDLMVNYKRYGDYILYVALRELCVKELSEFKADVYVPVPTSPEHIAKRQFDTITALYGSLVPLTNMLGKKAGLGAQGEKNRAERLTSEQSFFVKENFTINFQKCTVILLDDIYTTGRTLYHARDALAKIFPNAKISSFTLCR